MESNSCYCVTTRRFTLRCGHEDWLGLTQDLYNQVVFFYYELFLRLEEEAPGRLTGLSSQRILRELEVCSIVGRDKNPVPFPLPWNKTPLYLRRAAINRASAAARGYFAKRKTGRPAGRAQRFLESVTFYKGMYRDLTSRSVSLKLWDGAKWTWLNCRLSRNTLPGEAEPLSPSVVLSRQGAALLVPVREKVTDGRKAECRIRENTKICSVQFTNGDAIAVAVIMDCGGEQKKVRFFKGGRQYSGLCRELMEKIRISEASMGLVEGHRTEEKAIGNMVNLPQKEAAGEEAQQPVKEGREPPPEAEKTCPERERINNRYWMKLKNTSNHYAHSISRQIVDFCAESQAGIIVLPAYDKRFTGCVMYRVGNWSPLHLSLRIRRFLSYKAWKAGIVVLEVSAGGTSSVCSRCGAPVRRKEDICECSNGHRVSRHLNTARNLGRKCLKGFDREIS